MLRTAMGETDGSSKENSVGIMLKMPAYQANVHIAAPMMDLAARQYVEMLRRSDATTALLSAYWQATSVVVHTNDAVLNDRLDFASISV